MISTNITIVYTGGKGGFHFVLSSHLNEPLRLGHMGLLFSIQYMVFLRPLLYTTQLLYSNGWKNDMHYIHNNSTM